MLKNLEYLANGLMEGMLEENDPKIEYFRTEIIKYFGLGYFILIERKLEGALNEKKRDKAAAEDDFRPSPIRTTND